MAPPRRRFQPAAAAVALRREAREHGALQLGDVAAQDLVEGELLQQLAQDAHVAHHRDRRLRRACNLSHDVDQRPATRRQRPWVVAWAHAGGAPRGVGQHQLGGGLGLAAAHAHEAAQQATAIRHHLQRNVPSGRGSGCVQLLLEEEERRYCTPGVGVDLQRGSVAVATDHDGLASSLCGTTLCYRATKPASGSGCNSAAEFKRAEAEIDR